GGNAAGATDAADAAIERAGERIDETLRRLAAPAPAAERANDLPDMEFEPAMEPEKYRSMVRKAKEYIAAGDIFQVVLAQRFTVPFALPPFALYRALRRINPSPF